MTTENKTPKQNNRNHQPTEEKKTSSEEGQVSLKRPLGELTPLSPGAVEEHASTLSLSAFSQVSFFSPVTRLWDTIMWGCSRKS